MKKCVILILTLLIVSSLVLCVSAARFFVEDEGDLLAQQEQGIRSDETDGGLTGKTVLICLGIGVVVGLLTVFVMRSQLKTVRAQSYAGSYVQHGSLELTGVQDIYLYRNVVRTEKPKAKSSSGSGSF